MPGISGAGLLMRGVGVKHRHAQFDINRNRRLHLLAVPPIEGTDTR
jgi:hypothetical protein